MASDYFQSLFKAEPTNTVGFNTPANFPDWETQDIINISKPLSRGSSQGGFRYEPVQRSRPGQILTPFLMKSFSI